MCKFSSPFSAHRTLLVCWAPIISFISLRSISKWFVWYPNENFHQRPSSLFVCALLWNDKICWWYSLFGLVIDVHSSTLSIRSRTAFIDTTHFAIAMDECEWHRTIRIATLNLFILRVLHIFIVSFYFSCLLCFVHLSCLPFFGSRKKDVWRAFVLYAIKSQA